MAQNSNVAEAYQVAAITQGVSHNANVTAAAQSAAIVQCVVNTENNVADISSLRPLQIFLHTIVGLTQTQWVSVAAGGYEYFMNFENIQWYIIKKWISAVRNKNINRGGLSVSAVKDNSIHALVF